VSRPTRAVAGIHPVRELLRAGRPLLELRVAHGRSDSAALDELVTLARAAGVAVQRVSADELDALAPGQVHQGVVATAPAFPLVDVKRLLAHVEASGRPALQIGRAHV
jgi:23S rRNA (guanosine2251-2'-O)-methyltransferase